MKLKVIKKVFLGSISAGLLAGCQFFPGSNIGYNVYGPPPSEEFDPSKNENIEVYGPPEMFEMRDNNDQE